MKLKKILNFSLVNCSLHILKIPFLIFALIFSVLLPAQDNGFFEKTRIQHKINEARHYLIQGNVKSALLNYKEALALNPSSDKAEYGLAQCYYKLQDYSNAKFHGEKAYKANPEVDDDVLYLLGRTYFRLNDLKNAKDKLTQFKNSTNSKSKLEDYAIDLKLAQIDYAEKSIVNENITIKNMGNILNTSAPEFAPAISNDGKYLLFTSRRADTKGGGVDHHFDHSYYSDIYLSKWDDKSKSWSEPSNLLGRMNTEFHDGNLSFMPDNSILIYRNIWNVTKSGDIYQASYNGDGDWGTPKPILYRNKAISNKINSSYFESSASMTLDEKFIYFVSERPSGKGQTDIYFVEKIGKNYTEPQPVGDHINTTGDEKCVFVHPSNKVLFFTSNGIAESMGSYDIYYCTKQEDGSWSNPKNMGAPINTSLEEKTINVSKDGKTAFIGGYYDIKNQGDADLYQIDISSFNFKVD